MIRFEETTLIHAPIERVFDLSRSIDMHLASTSKTKEQAIRGVTSGLIEYGQQVTWRASHFGVRQLFTSEITGFEAPDYFQDTMRSGAFESFQHDHFFRFIAPARTEMKDVLRFAAPYWFIGLAAERLVLRNYMQGFLRARNRMLKEVAESDEWRRYLPGETA